MHASAPYRVEGVNYHGGDRLLWARDVDHLVRALGFEGLAAAAAKARAMGVEAALSSALQAARHWLGAAVPDAVLKELDEARLPPAARYLAAGRLRRVGLDLGKVRNPLARVKAIAGKLLPSEIEFHNQPKSARLMFHIRRWSDLLMPARGRR
jgi:hypothetical protein